MNIQGVTVSEELSAYISARIAGFEHECEENRRWLLPYVRKHQILPLFLDWLETVGIQKDGSVRKFSADGEHSQYEGLRVIEEQNLFTYSLVQGAKYYPPLQSIIPQRPDNAINCKSCSGAGSSEFHPNVICACGGLGWQYAVAV